MTDEIPCDPIGAANKLIAGKVTSRSYSRLLECVDETVIPRLIEAIRNREYGRVEHLELIVQALERIGSASVQPLSDLYEQAVTESPNDERIRLVTIDALSEISDPQGVGTLILALSDRDVEVRMSALFGLISNPHSDAVEPLIERLSNDELPLQWLAAKALGKIGDARAIPSLTDVLQHKDKKMRHLAANALRTIGTPEALKALENFRY